MDDREILQQTRLQCLEALRHREQEIFQYLAILVPAVIGFGWLLHDSHGGGFEFFVGTVIVIGSFLFGAGYSWGLGYHYRYLVFQLVKLEKLLGIQPAMLKYWQVSLPEGFLYPKFRHTPPEVIKVFWYAFLWMIVFVTGIAFYKFHLTEKGVIWDFGTWIIKAIIFIIGAFCFWVGNRMIPQRFDKKLRDLYEKEDPAEWAIERYHE